MAKSKYPDRIYVERDPETNEKRWYSVKGMGEEYVRAALPPDADVAGTVDEWRRERKRIDTTTHASTDAMRWARAECDRKFAFEAAALITRLSAELAEARAEIERMTPNFVAYDYLESPAGREIVEDRATAAEARIAELERELSDDASSMAFMTQQRDFHRRRATAAEAERDRLREALRTIAALDDRRASDHLHATGSFALFDEPGSVEIARTALGEKADG